jgi:glycerol-3-phosphate dehydrogenase (NAD(P)+)
MKSKKVTVLGAGSWGTVLAHMLASSGHQVCLWARSEAFVKHVKSTGRFIRPVDLNLPESIKLTNSLNEALLEPDLLLCAIPSEGVSELIQQVKALNPKLSLVLSATKGLDQATGKLMTDLWEEAFDVPVAALSGPNLSAEAALAKPMRTIIGAKSFKVAEEICVFFNVRNFKLQQTTDLIGLEIAGAAKNVIALAAGAWDGLNLGTSGKGAMLTRALAELAELVQLIGGNRQTAYSVAGIGDLYITCSSPLSRNYQTGYGLGQGKTLAQIKTELKGQVAEGVWTTPLIHKLAQKHNCQFKICNSVYWLLTKDLSRAEEKYKLEEMFVELV